ncbi:RNA polymerase II subunit A C-terminal domain phosphatase isoform X2 [Ictalurus furcatus]|uniref:RNA polymerase II subunit A C-terminal domain phosphatase isoform X2 n=1 Tax=Ictalurus furcatus TaxID=66913 RepID=UPI0023509E2F|nr:RNA polymerase II subunit A C-terminal domain phosphatase isoform X2 [Ictalurus furcatus]
MEVTEIRLPAGARAVRLREWKVEPGALVKVDSVIALCVAVPTDTECGSEDREQPKRRLPEKKVKSDRAGVVRELCYQLGEVISPGDVIARIEECSHPIVMKGLCAECGQDLTQLQNRNGKQQTPISTAMVSMVHSVPELMVSSEQAEQLGREDQKRLHRNKKLVLMVDLDQTVIHTTEQHCQNMSTKGIFHFQLGRGEPMLHTRLRPYCKEFLEKISKMYELHVFTFGSRLYAHTIAGFLDPEKKLFSHRILSRDECIDPFSKTGNLRNLFPCGDSMVCIIDDREDVWKFAPNLITVKKYVYFKGTGDINAPPGSREAQLSKKSAGSQPAENTNPSGPSSDEGKNNGVRKQDKDKKSLLHEMSVCVPDIQGASASQRTDPDGKRTEKSHLSNKSDIKVEELGGSDRMRESGETVDQENVTVADSDDSAKPGLPHNNSARLSETIKLKQTSLDEENCGAEENGDGGLDTDSVCDMDEESFGDNGCSDKKETETESQNSEQSGVTMGEESLDHSMVDEEEEEEEDDTDQDDHLIYLQEILIRIHNEYYSRYEAHLRGDCSDMPDIRKIVPELKSSSLAGTNIVFSGLYPTNYPMERTRESYHAKALGAKISKNLVLDAKDPNFTTHLVAARVGTEKVRQAQVCEQLHVVNPDWLWGCLERWDRVDEQLFPLKEDYTKSQRSNSPSPFPDVQESFPAPVIDPVSIQPKGPLAPEVHTYDSVTGKLIRRGPQVPRHPQKSSVTLPGHEVHFRDSRFLQQEDGDRSRPDDNQPAPSRRKRQQSLSETMPLYTLCKEDLDSMDREVDDILGEESDNDSEGKEKEERVEEEEDEESSRQSYQQALGTAVKDTTSASKEDSSRTGSVPRGHKRKLQDAREDDDDKDGDFASQSSKESNEDGSSSEADEMAAALEAELNDFM